MVSKKVSYVLSKRGRMILFGAAILAAVVAVALALKPSAEKKAALEQQERLLASIAGGDGEIALEGEFFAEEVDFYEDDVQDPQTTAQSAVASGAPSKATATEKRTSTERKEAEKPAKIVVEGIGVLSIDKIDLKLPVAYGASEANLKVAAGWVSETASIGGEGNAVIAGHRSYTRGHFFNRLGELGAGDIIAYADKAGNRMRFEVYETLEVLPGDQAAFVQPVGESEITLLTCTPVRSATHRLLVRAKRVD